MRHLQLQRLHTDLVERIRGGTAQVHVVNGRLTVLDLDAEACFDLEAACTKETWDDQGRLKTPGSELFAKPATPSDIESVVPGVPVVLRNRRATLP